MGRGFMAMMSAMAEDERLRIIKRTHEARQIARAKCEPTDKRRPCHSLQWREFFIRLFYPTSAV
jgi:DNA invertase Pin-like site-specific DNA recombinase